MNGSESGDFSRVNRPLAQGAAYYSRLAPWYDLLAASEKKFIWMGLDLLDPQPGENILEIGFGTGAAQGKLIPAVKSGLSVGVDLSTGMASWAKRKLERANLASQALLVCSDSLPLPFCRNAFQGLFSSFTLELFDTPQIPQLLAECRRVLVPGGRLVAVSLSKDQPLGAMGRLYERFHDRFPTLADCRPIPLRQILESNGFKVKEFEIGKMWGLLVSLVSATS